MLKGGKVKAHILEEDVVEEITTRLWLHYRIRVWRVRERIPGEGALSTPGIPDLMGWLSVPRNPDFPTIESIAQPLFIEVKRPGGAHRTAQTLFIDEAKSGGCVAFFAESWDDVAREIEEHRGFRRKEAV